MPLVKTPTCLICGGTSTVEMTDDQFKKLIEGTGYIQDILPEKTVDERELLISGTHPACWDTLWGEDD